MRVEVVYAERDSQHVVSVDIANGATVAIALAAAASLPGFPAVDPGKLRVGIFSKLASAETPLVEGDRVEIYRPLQADPREARRRRAQKKLRR